MMSALLFAAAAGALPPRPVEAVAVARARILRGVVITLATAPRRSGKPKLIEFQ